jgi:hypothetical protein
MTRREREQSDKEALHAFISANRLPTGRFPMSIARNFLVGSPGTCLIARKWFKAAVRTDEERSKMAARQSVTASHYKYSQLLPNVIQTTFNSSGAWLIRGAYG